MAGTPGSIAIDLPVQVKLSRKSALAKHAEELGVTSFYDEIMDIQKDLEDALKYERALGIEMADARLRLNDREVEIAFDIHGKYADQSGAERERIIKRTVDVDDVVEKRKLRVREISDKQSEVGIRVEILRRGHRAMLAQMDILGNYFAVLAASKDGVNIGRLMGADLF